MEVSTEKPPQKKRKIEDKEADKKTNGEPAREKAAIEKPAKKKEEGPIIEKDESKPTKEQPHVKAGEKAQKKKKNCREDQKELVHSPRTSQQQEAHSDNVSTPTKSQVTSVLVTAGKSGIADETSAGAAAKYTVGSKVLYWSHTHQKWIETRVTSVNADGTIDVKGKIGAKLELIKPIESADATATASADMVGQCLPKGARCYICSRKAPQQMCGIVCRRRRDDDSVGGCGKGVCWKCMKEAPDGTFGVLRCKRDDVKRLGAKAWWMHHDCMTLADSMDFSVLMLPPPS